jgi:hypothetical protein
MKRFILHTMLVVMASAALAAQAGTVPRQAQEVARALVSLPAYSVFDALTFNYANGVVTLEGYVVRPSLKADAERVARRVAGVEQVVNNIVELPPSLGDDDLRYRTFVAIYTNPTLSRYVPGGGLSSVVLDAIRRDMQRSMYPTEDYPIHIIVQNAHVRLFGTVDNAADKLLIENAARGVSGALKIENNLAVSARR